LGFQKGKTLSYPNVSKKEKISKYFRKYDRSLQGSERFGM